MEPWRDELYHHGIKGQKWGIRRYQNEDGTLTAAGYQKRLRELDRRARIATVEAANSQIKSSKYAEKLTKPNSKEDSEKYYKEMAKYKERSDAFLGIRDKTVKEINDTLASLKKSGFDYKVRSLDFTRTEGAKFDKTTNELLKKYGKVEIDSVKYTNASNENVFFVKESSKMSDKKKRSWVNKKTMKLYEPQIVY